MSVLEKQAPLNSSHKYTGTLKVSVVMPTYNEAENICPLIDAVYKEVPNLYECIVVDDNSPDGTAELVAAHAKNFPQRRIRIEKRLTDRGLTKSIAHGIAKADGDVVVWMDCDFSMPPELISELLQCVANGYDIAVGSRFVRGGSFKRNTKDSSDSALAVFLSRVMNYTIQLLLDHSFRDYTSGFIAVRKSVLNEIPLRGFYGEYFIDLIFRALHKGYRVTEVPYICLPRAKGVSKTGASVFQFIKLGTGYLKVAAKLRTMALFMKTQPTRTSAVNLLPLADSQVIDIQQMQTKHIPLVAGLHHQVLFGTLNSRLGVAFLEDLYGTLLFAPHAQAWVAMADDKLTGFIAISTDLAATKSYISKNIEWKDRISVAVRLLSQWNDFKEFISHEIFFRACRRIKNPYATILTLGVAPFAQRKSVGSKLMVAAESHFHASGLQDVFVDTLATNQAAKAFYRGRGYTEIKELFGNCIFRLKINP